MNQSCCYIIFLISLFHFTVIACFVLVASVMDVSPQLRTKILTLHQFTTLSQRKIAAEVGVNQSSVSRIIAHQKKNGSLTPARRGKCGRKRKLTSREERLLVQENKKLPFMTSNEHKRSLNLKVSTRTVRRVLVRKGRISKRPYKKQLLTSQMIRKRLAWGRKHRSWTSEQWKKVLFTDESHFIVQGYQNQFIRRAAGEPLSPLHVNQCVKHPPKVMFWGCFSSSGPGRLHVCEGMMDSQQYVKVIDTRILPEMNQRFPNGDGILQQDQAPCHRSKKSTQHLESKGIQVLEWPGNSPDLAPIETLWAILKSRLRKEDVSTKQKLISSVLRLWHHDERIKESCAKLAEGMPKRIEELIQNRGGHIRY